MTNTFFDVILSLFADAASLSHPHRQAEITSSNTSKMLILSSSLRAILCGICFFNIVPLAPCVGGPLVLYGSQTGAAEDVAYHIAEGIRRRGLSPRCMAMDEYDVGCLPKENTVLFVASTTGDGVAPLNMRKTWCSLLKKDLPNDALSGVDYAVFGLGDSSYAKYNAAARRLDARLAQLGGKRLLEVGLGDDQDPLGEDSALGPWTEGLHAKLQLRGGESSSTAPGSSAVTFASPYRVVVEADSCPVERGEMSEAEARSIVQSIVCMDDVVVFSRGAPRAGGSMCSDTAALVKALRVASIHFRGLSNGLCEGNIPEEFIFEAKEHSRHDLSQINMSAYRSFFDALRSTRIAEALRKLSIQPPAIYYRASPTDLSELLAMERPTVHSQCTVEAAATPTSFPNSYASDAYPQESCLNDVWGGVGGNGHRWMAGQLRGDWRAGVAVCSERMTASWMKDRDVRHVRISLSDRVSTHDQDMVQNPSLDYSPGDVANVLPRNRPAAVEEFIYIMGLDGSARIRSIEPTDSSCGYAMSRLNVVPPCSVTDLISAHFDIEGVPRCRLIKRLALSARDAMQREKLLELASPEGADELQEYLRGGRRTVTTLLQDFPSVRVSLDELLDLIPRLRPRPYSIASSPLAHKGEIHICSALVQRPSSTGGVRQGVCSSFLMDLREGDIVPLTLSAGSMAFDSRSPSIVVGPGTGIAPFRSFLWERECLGAPCLPVVAFFGCRNEGGDCLYRDELRKLEEGCAEGLKVHHAFSRDIEGKKVYVQDLIKQNAAEIWAVLESGGRVYVAGARGGMPKGVREAFQSILSEEGRVDDASAYVDRMIKEGRYREEVW